MNNMRQPTNWAKTRASVSPQRVAESYNPSIALGGLV